VSTAWASARSHFPSVTDTGLEMNDGSDVSTCSPLDACDADRTEEKSRALLPVALCIACPPFFFVCTGTLPRRACCIMQRTIDDDPRTYVMLGRFFYTYTGVHSVYDK